MLRVGFVVNPVAGMGGAVGLKGTDGDAVLQEAISRGARMQALDRAVQALRGVTAAAASDILFLTCKGQMGEKAFAVLAMPCDVVCGCGDITSASDTRAAVREFVSRQVDIVVFVGGDGTARDVLAEAGSETPIIGIPSGVKMHSAVFANTPGEFADLLTEFGRSRALREAEVLDVDEASFREGQVRAQLFGIALTPDSPGHVQAGKQSYASGTASEEADEIGQYLADSMEPGVLYIIGPGGTTARIAEAIGQPKTLLGVDVYKDRVRVLADASESDLLDMLAEDRKSSIVVSPIGAQGFFLGRGNQQISPSVLRIVGRDRVLVVSTPTKLRGTPVLRVDTGDPSLDVEFRGSMKVITGYKRRRMVEVA
jgi:predicted polyphosphate/ATP-dependent NAD kinase